MDVAPTWTLLSRLIGTWQGSGRGEFPTIEAFTYRETFEVVEVVPGRRLHYRQRTWRTSVDPAVPSHVETGFINLSPEGQIELLNAQGSDRVEAMTGTIDETPGGFMLKLASRSLADDDRMLTSWREWTLDGDNLIYTMGMSTTAVPIGSLHLEAELRRFSGT